MEAVLKRAFAVLALIAIGSPACRELRHPGMQRQNIPAAVVEDKIRGGLLGQVLGDLNGLEHEMKYIDEPGKVMRYVPDLSLGAWTDDDTDIEWIYVLEMQRSGELALSSRRITELWKRHINRNIWCSNQYLRQLMDIGIEPPLTGRLALNPWADFNLSGQFVAETWGLISPGMPATAGRLGLHYTHVGIEGEPAQATQMFAAMVSTAFLTSDMERILDSGAAALDPGSEFRRILRDVRRWHGENPGDWRASRRRIRDGYTRYGGRDLRDRNGVILNGAATLAALLYGGGDLTETIRHAFNFGWDCDNNAAMCGAILGVIKGHRWMRSQGWNIRDGYRDTSRDHVPMDETLTRFGDRLVALADRVIREQGGEKVTMNGGTVYRLKVEKPVNLERLPDLKNEPEILRKRLKREITHSIGSGPPGSLARAAYLAVCLGMAHDMRRQNPVRWAAALAELQSKAKVMQALFHESPIPAGDALRLKALEAGLVKPAQQVRLWTEN